MTNFFQWLLDNVAGGLLVATVSGIGGYLLTFVLSRRSQPNNSFKYFPPSDDGRTNEAFYDYFLSKIQKAKSSIYVTGDGFSCLTAEGTKLALNYSDAFKRAARNNVQIVRVQTSQECSETWIGLVGELLDLAPNNVSQYVLTEQKRPDMMSVCVIDPQSAKDCTVEIMISTQDLFGSRAVGLAGTAMFIEGNQMLAKDIRDHIIKMTDSSVSARANNSTEVRQLLKANC